MTRDECRRAAAITGALTIVWYLAGVIAWTETQAPVWYRVVLAFGGGLTFWFVSGWLVDIEKRR